MRVSIIVTSHNYGHFLAECLESIRAQTFKDYELIVIDDASQDNTVEVARAYSPNRLIRFGTNQGFARATNYGIKISSGEYVCQINADDILEPIYLERCVQALDADPESAIAYTDCIRFGNNQDGELKFEDYSFERLLKYNFILGSSLVRRQALFDAGLWPEDLSGMEDYDLWLTICSKGWKAVHVPEMLYRYRSHESNRTREIEYRELFKKIWDRHGLSWKSDLEFPDLKQPEAIEITATISTKDRYFTTLPLAINAIAQQTYRVKELIIFDDGEHRDLREVPVYKNLFAMLEGRGIFWRFIFGQRKGQVWNHQLALEMALGNWIWRVDDDCIPQSDALERLVKNIREDVGAIGGLVIDPKQAGPLPKIASSKIEDIFLGLNIQWFYHEGVSEVDHLYSTFLFRKKAGRHGYCLELSPVGHREETIFTHEIKRAGWKVLVDASAVIWHVREATGGIRSFNDHQYWIHDEEVFKKKLMEWGVQPSQKLIIPLNCGLGDHLIFKRALPQIQANNKDRDIVLSVCYPEVFKDSGLPLISIAEGEMILGKKQADDRNIYKWCWDRDWKKSLEEAFVEMYR